MRTLPTLRFAFFTCGLLVAAGCEDPPTIPPPPDTGPPPMLDAGYGARCENGVLDGDESAIDCGGACDRCEPGSACRTADDCASGVCGRGFCLMPRCDDEVANGDEIGVDCGGSCGLCPGGQPCTANADCLSNRCMSGGVCAPSSCEDGVQNGDETDADCGGPTCPPCEADQTCARASDCESGACDGGRCTEASCSDRLQNQDETSIDCGGTTCPPCRDGLACEIDADCQGMRCLDGGCVSCTDRVQNAEETGVDCGGPLCDPCGDGESCFTSDDCASGRCLSNRCISCVDGVQNAEETDVDCGGGFCGPCGNGRACLTSADCTSADCASGICRGVADVCADAVALTEGLNVVSWTATGQEYLTSPPSCGFSYAPEGPDVVLTYTATLTGFLDYSFEKPASNRWHLVVSGAPCGTVTELACHSEYTLPSIGGEIPIVAGTTYTFYLADTTSGAAPVSNPLRITLEEEPGYCRDSSLNMDETDVDCGGPTCAPCLNGRTCASGSDCVSGDCTGGTCRGVGDTCSDAVTLTTGTNTVAWSAVGRDYLPLRPSCTLSYDVDGPDVVMRFTPPTSGSLTYTITKPTSTRWVAVVSSAACGTVSPQIVCESEFSYTALSETFPVTAGTTYWFYVADTVSGASPLSNPLIVDLTLSP